MSKKTDMQIQGSSIMWWLGYLKEKQCTQTYTEEFLTQTGLIKRDGISAWNKMEANKMKCVSGEGDKDGILNLYLVFLWDI